MSTQIQHGYLMLADISGYSAYLAGVELDHAHEILKELIELIVARFKPLLTIAELEGDAVFAYAPLSRVPRGETLLELIEATYVAFRDHVEAIRRRTTCTCRACQGLPTLDLKFITHHGSYILQDMAGVTKLVGTDINLAHRLLKNHVKESTGWRAYALFTDAVFDHMGCRPANLHTQIEEYDLGQVQTYSSDLHPRYRELTEVRHVVVTPEQAHQVYVVECAAPPPVVWEWLNDPRRRLEWEKLHIQPALRPSGRTAAGATNHCMHGKTLSMVETVLDWRPFEYYTVDKDSRMKTMPIDFVVTYRLESLADGTCTRLTVYVQTRMPMPKALLRSAGRFALKVFGIDQEFDRLARLIGQTRSSAPAMPFAAPTP
jgi:hypothetical protein